MACNYNDWKYVSEDDEAVNCAGRLHPDLARPQPSNQANDSAEIINEGLNSLAFDRDASVRRSVTVHCQQILNPNGSVLVNKHLHVRSTTLPRSAAESPSVLFVRNTHEGASPAAESNHLNAAHVCAIVLNESLRPKANPSGGDTSSFSTGSNISNSSRRKSSMYNNYMEVGLDYSSKPKGQMYPINEKNDRFVETKHFFDSPANPNRTKNWPIHEEQPCNDIGHSHRTDSDDMNNGSKLGTRFKAAIVQPNHTQDRKSTSAWSTLPRTGKPVPAQRLYSDSCLLYNSGFKPFYRAYSQEVFKHARKLPSFDSDAFELSSSPEKRLLSDSNTCEQPVYFIDMRSVCYEHDVACKAECESTTETGYGESSRRLSSSAADEDPISSSASAVSQSPRAFYDDDVFTGN